MVVLHLAHFIMYLFRFVSCCVFLKQLTIPEDGWLAGNAFGYGDIALPFKDEWQRTQGNFSLTTDNGEAIFLYCMSSTGMPKPLLAFSYGANIVEATNNTEYNSTTTSIPESLGEVGFINLVPHYNNMLLNRSTVLDENGEALVADEFVKAIIRDSQNWQFSDTIRWAVSPAMKVVGSRAVLAVSLISSIVWMMVL